MAKKAKAQQKIEMTPAWCSTFGWQAADMNARRHGRSSWNEEDRNVAAVTTWKWLIRCGFATLEMALSAGFERAELIAA